MLEVFWNVIELHEIWDEWSVKSNAIWLASHQKQIKDVCTENLPSVLVFFKRLFLVVLLDYVKHILESKKMEDHSVLQAFVI